MIQDMGMTDLQFKSWLKQIIRGLEDAKDKPTKEDTDKKLNELLQDLKEDLQGWLFAEACHSAFNFYD